MNNWATAQLRKLRKEMEAELNHYDPIVQMDVYQQMVDAHIEQLAETNNWSK
jgi:hypothetical protein